MNSIKAFISIPALENNVDGQTAIFGELSPLSLTFTRNMTTYVNDTTPGIVLKAFSRKTDAGVAYTPSSTVTDHILTVAAWIYQQYQDGLIPTNASKAVFIASLGAEFPAMASISINEIVTGIPSSSRLPDYVQWRFTDGGTVTENKIWFHDGRFQTQYDEFDIFVIPPIANIDDLNASTAVVAAFLEAVTPSDILNQVVTVQGGYPAPVLIPYTVTWTDPTLPTSTLPTDWTIVGYGPAAADADNIKAAIRQYIADNSALTVWSTIYPGLFAENEFVIVPLWEDLGVPESGLDVDIYRGMVNVGGLASLMSLRLPHTYAASVAITPYLNTNLVIAAAQFRSLMFMSVGNPNNAGSVFSLRTLYPDYLNTPSSSSDWGRMDVGTRDFITGLSDALEKALALTTTSAVPVGYTRVIRDARVYLGWNFGGFKYLVLSKGSY